MNVGKLKKLIRIEAFDLKSSTAIGYYYDKVRKSKIHRRFNFRITESGKPEIGKPSPINKNEYQRLLNQYGEGRSVTFNELKEIFGFIEDDTRATT